MKDRIEVDGERFISTNMIVEKYGPHETTISRWNQSGVLPMPIKIGRRNFYNEREIDSQFLRTK